MGVFSILSRFAPIEPVMLMGHLRSERWDIGAPVAASLAEVAAGLLTLKAIVALDDGAAQNGVACPIHRLADLMKRGRATDDGSWKRFAFDHPLFVLFSSGTTGQPKCILHGAGGTLLEHLKEHRLHCDLRQGDRLFFHTRSEEHTSELQSQSNLVCRLLLEKKKESYYQTILTVDPSSYAVTDPPPSSRASRSTAQPPPSRPALRRPLSACSDPTP